MMLILPFKPFKNISYLKDFGKVKNPSGTNSNEIILEYRGHEMGIREAIERMECYGYISKYDFKCDW